MLEQAEREKISVLVEKFQGYLRKITEAVAGDDEEEYGNTIEEFAHFFASLTSRVLSYENLLTRIMNKSTSDHTRRVISKMLEPDNSEDVDEFMKLINKKEL